MSLSLKKIVPADFDNEGTTDIALYWDGETLVFAKKPTRIHRH
jgi:hypothetical protein